MHSSTLLMSREYLLAVVLGASILTDIYSGKVLNWIVMPAMVLGLACGGLLDGWPGVSFSGAGLVVGGGVLFLPFLFGIMGGGDVKLAAAVGSMTGTMFVLEALAYAFVLAAGLALLTSAAQGRVKELFMESWNILARYLPMCFDRTGGSMESVSKGDRGVPFAACLAGGALGAKWFGFFNIFAAS